eukprot:GSChrysophyteH1.ASY1.ANO1.1222.1 assembled CDS
MTPTALKLACLDNEGFETPALNDKLYLHFKGFRRIENLEEYTSVKTLFLESNGIQRIENLDCLCELRSLYLQQNIIEQIENLESLCELRTLNLSQNRLTRVDNLGGLVNLETLNLSKNALSDIDGLRDLLNCERVNNLDVSGNNIEDEAFIDEILVHMPRLSCLYLKGNPIVRNIRHYRKTLIVKLPRLSYLDDRPVFELERLAAEAWAHGGRDAEIAARRAYKEAEVQRARDERARFTQWKAERRAKRFEENGKLEEPELQEQSSPTEPNAQACFEDVPDAASCEEATDSSEESKSLRTLAETSCLISSITSADEADDLQEEEDEGYHAAEVQERHAAVQESLRIYRSQQRMAPAPGDLRKYADEDSSLTLVEAHKDIEVSENSSRLEVYDSALTAAQSDQLAAHVQEAEDEDENYRSSRSRMKQITYRRQISAPRSIVWDKITDETLQRLTRECIFDFDAVALRMGGKTRGFTPDSCRLRFAELERGPTLTNETEKFKPNEESSSSIPLNHPQPPSVPQAAMLMVPELRNEPAKDVRIARPHIPGMMHIPPARVNMDELPSMFDSSGSDDDDNDDDDYTEYDTKHVESAAYAAARYATVPADFKTNEGCVTDVDGLD